MFYLSDELCLLLRGSVLEELLNNVVPEDVCHERVGRRGDLLKDETLLRGGGTLQLLLDEPAPVLVLAELNHVGREVAEADVRVAVVPEKRNEDRLQKCSHLLFVQPQQNLVPVSNSATVSLHR